MTMKPSSQSRLNKKQNDIGWYRLDNAGKLYPSLISKRRTSLFRITAHMKHIINVSELQNALSRLMPRFPYYNVNLKKGGFWYYFESNPHPVRLEQDSLYPCMAHPLKGRGIHPFRVRVYKKSISVEFSHVITDATGALTFLKSLLWEYKGDNTTPDEKYNIILKDSAIDPSEMEDAFKINYKKGLPLPQRSEKSWHLHERLLPKGFYYITTGILDTERLKEESNKLSCTITEFLVAVLMDSFQKKISSSKKKKAPIRINLPINMRNFYTSKTMRNFFLTIEPHIDPRLGYYQFGEIVEKVKLYMRYTIDKKIMAQQITRNVEGESSLLVKLLPSGIKDLLIPIVYNELAEGTYTSGLSNIGNVLLPKPLKNEIERFDFIPPPSTGTKLKCAVISFDNIFSISFGRLVKNSEIEKEFFRKLIKMGIAVKIESNIRS